MKKIYITVGLLIALQGYSQSNATKKADAFVESYQYTKAIDEYLKLADTKDADAYVYTKLADSYFAIFNMDEAAKWYARATEKNADAETYYNYATALKTQGKYAEANKQMDKFATLQPNDDRAIDHKANPNYIPALAAKTKLFDSAIADINSKDKSDFGALLTNENTLYFVSSRSSSSKKDMAGQSFIDVYKSTRNENGTFSEPVAVSELNTAYHDGPITISADGNTIYFASEGQNKNFKKGKKYKISQQGIYKAVKLDGKFTNIQPLPFNSVDYSVGSPSLSADGKILYFASDMPGGLGDTDIWKVSVNNDGTYGVPQNLGKLVNTPGKENFPFIADDNVLYFASLSRQGFGGFDVFKADLGKGTEAENLGKPVNSEKDDFSFSFNSAKNIGFYSSNRGGTDNIYTATPVCGVEAIAIVKDKNTGAILSDAKVAILDTKQNVIATKQSNSKGEVSYDVECNTGYTFLVEKSGYDAAQFTVAKTNDKQVKVEALLAPEKMIVTKSEIVINEITFDFNKSNITKEGARELNKLVRVLNSKLSMALLVKSHTDSKGSDEYNNKLSEKRAQSTVQYLISKGIDASRISGKGYGETEPKINCGDNCTPEQDAQNRRSEFLIVKK
jgi:outer membrane protein OmpA-like peptidoglycan-associated protein/tetratricopeptide (TPR) repeat protein